MKNNSHFLAILPIAMKSKDKVRELISNEIQQKNYSQAELGDKIGVSQALIYKILHTNATLATPSLLKIARYFGTTINELLGEEPISGTLARIYAEGAPAVRQVPVLNKASCGKWVDFTDLSYPAGHADHFEYANTTDPHAFFLKATGDSMTGSGIYEGDLLLVEPSMQVENGHVVLAMGESGKTVKRFKRTDGMIILIPMNEKYEPIILSAEQVERENMRFYRITQTVRRL